MQIQFVNITFIVKHTFNGVARQTVMKQTFVMAWPLRPLCSDLSWAICVVEKRIKVW